MLSGWNAGTGFWNAGTGFEPVSTGLRLLGFIWDIGK
jgi:hypothetical protein